VPSFAAEGDTWLCSLVEGYGRVVCAPDEKTRCIWKMPESIPTPSQTLSDAIREYLLFKFKDTYIWKIGTTGRSE
jgi:hypothetical protein